MKRGGESLDEFFERAEIDYMLKSDIDNENMEKALKIINSKFGTRGETIAFDDSKRKIRLIPGSFEDAWKHLNISYDRMCKISFENGGIRFETDFSTWNLHRLNKQGEDFAASIFTDNSIKSDYDYISRLRELLDNRDKYFKKA